MKLFLSLFLALSSGSLIAQQSSTEAKSYGSNDVYDVVLKAANEGNASAQCEIGRQNYNATPPDYEKAALWFRKAAVQGYPKAQHSLGVCLSNGNGLTKDENEAVTWFRKAAEQGDVKAQRDLGYSYKYGKGIAKDEVEAIKWYRKAAEQGNAIAQYNLGNCYANGSGVAIDDAEAIKWYQKASDNGYEPARKKIADKKAANMPDEERLANLKAKADTFKGKTLVFKGLYLDMPIEDAAVLLAIHLGNDKIKAMPSNVIKSFSDGKWFRDEESGVRVTANTDGKVTAFFLPRKAIEKLFDSKNTDVTEFLKTFQAAYDLPDFIAERVPLEFFSKNEIVGKTQGIQPVASKLGFQAKWTATGKNGFSVAAYGNPTVFEESKLNELVMGGTVETIPSCSLLIKKINKAAFD